MQPYRYESLESGIRANGFAEDYAQPSKPRGLYRLPEPSPGDVFFDMEGDPYYDIGTGLEYLSVSFGLLFQREIGGFGSSLGWGAAYGMLWWFLGPLTILPLLQRKPIDWSYAPRAHSSARWSGISSTG